MLGAVHPRRAGVQERRELAAVEVPPGPFLGVVVDGKDPVALRTGKERPLRMARPGVHALVANGELDPAHLPRGTRGPTGSGKAPCLASRHGREAVHATASEHLFTHITHRKPGSA